MTSLPPRKKLSERNKTLANKTLTNEEKTDSPSPISAKAAKDANKLPPRSKSAPLSSLRSSTIIETGSKQEGTLSSLKRNAPAVKKLPAKPQRNKKQLTGAAKRAAEKKEAEKIAAVKRAELKKQVGQNNPQRVTSKQAAKGVSLMTTEAIPWPDWTHTERNSVRSIELAPMLSRAPYRQWWERHDLWWSDELFRAGNPTWRVPGKKVWVDTTSITGQPARRRILVPEFKGNPSRRSLHTRDIIATLLMWHHATSRQLAAICGHHPTNFSGRHLKPLYDAGVIERGRFSSSTEMYDVRHDYCYRLRLGDPLWRWLDKFDDETWTNITYGIQPTEPRNHVRHNLMTLEIGLRIMEAVPNVTTVYGERPTSMRKLLGVENKQHGDMGVVRSDGLRIVVELIHEQYREGFSNKVASWAKALTANGTVNDHGTVVVFVVAAKNQNEALRETRRRFQEVLTPQGLTDGRSGVAADPNRVANARLHIFLTSWSDWFPGPHSISTEFTKLTGWRLNAKDQYVPVDLIDNTTKNGYPFQPKDPLAWSMPAQLSDRLHAQPFWLRTQPQYAGPEFPAVHNLAERAEQTNTNNNSNNNSDATSTVNALEDIDWGDN